MESCPKPASALVVILSVLAAAPAPTQAAAPAGDSPAAETGVVEGRIAAGSGHAAVAGATVTLSPEERSTTSDGEGRYRFEQVPSGHHEISISVEGLPTNTTSIDVTAATTTHRDIEIDRRTGSVTLETLRVTAQRTPIGVARAIQKDAPNLVNILPVEEIRKLPDVNAAEAVSRLPGISLETDTGEGRFINIRGLDSDLNSTTFGGVRLPPTNPASPSQGGRAVAFDSIPAGLIGAFTLTKTNTPDQDAEALGGTIEITPKTVPENGKPFVEGKIGSGVEPLRSTPIYDGEITAGGRFGFGDASGNSFAAKPFSVLATVTSYEDRRGIDDLEADYQVPGGPSKAYVDLQQRFYNYHRRRYGFGGELAFQPDGVDRWYLRYFEAGYSETVNRQRLVIDTLDGGNTVDPSNPNGFVSNTASYSKSLRDERERLKSRVLSFGGSNDFDTFKLDYRGSYAVGTYRKGYDLNSTFSNPNAGTVAYDNTTDPNFPTYRVLAGPNPVDPSGYTLDGIRNSTTDNRDQEWAGVGNLSLPVHFIGSDEETIKTGLSARLRTRHQSGTTSRFTPGSSVPLSSAITNDFTTFYDDRYQNGFDINADVPRALYAGSNPVVSPDLGAFQDDRENVYAGYGQYQFALGALGVLTGVRIEDTDSRYIANVQSDTPGVPAQNTRTRSYVDVFPSLQLRYALSPKWISRLVYSATIARPGFNQVNAGVSVDVGNSAVTQGNPDLKPILANNLDLDTEYYFASGGILSLGLFDKELSDYIVRTRQSNYTVPNSPIYAGLTGPVQLDSFINVSSARAYGAELNYEQRFRSLPGALSGLGISGNYTFVQSSLAIRPTDHTQLPSTSKNTFNAAVFYEKYGVNVRLAAAYVGKNIFAVGDNPSTDIWSQSRFSVDLGSSYAFNKHLSAYLNAKNLTNTPLKFTEGSGTGRPVQREFYDTSIQGGVRFSF